jgi:hypothetical protein
MDNSIGLIEIKITNSPFSNSAITEIVHSLSEDQLDKIMDILYTPKERELCGLYPEAGEIIIEIEPEPGDYSITMEDVHGDS